MAELLSQRQRHLRIAAKQEQNLPGDTVSEVARHVGERGCQPAAAVLLMAPRASSSRGLGCEIQCTCLSLSPEHSWPTANLFASEVFVCDYSIACEAADACTQLTVSVQVAKQNLPPRNAANRSL